MSENYQKFTVTRDNEPDLRFEGILLASVQNSSNQASDDYSGEVGRSTVLKLYCTKGGTFVCARIERSLWVNEDDCYFGHSCKDEAGVVDFFGQSRLAEELYHRAGLDNSIEIE